MKPGMRPGDACEAAWDPQQWPAMRTPQQAVWPLAGPVLGQALLPGERKARRMRGRGRITPASHVSSRRAVSTQCASPWGPGHGCSPASPTGTTQPPADL